MEKKIAIFDSSLRDGAQAEGISFSVQDKINVVKALDEIGIPFIEAGNPGSNPKDMEFFEKVRHISLKHAKLAAFGSTRRAHVPVEEDQNVRLLLDSGMDIVVIFGKTWNFHVTDVIRTTLEENLEMIKDTVSYLKEKGKEVFFDAEHFYDGYKENADYALRCLSVAAEAGASHLVLCDTNGGALPTEIYQITKKVVDDFSIPIAIHCHNDSGMAVANSLMGVEAGAVQVQGTLTGFGERCGNANLSSIIPNLQLKMGYSCIEPDKMQSLTSTARRISEIANLALNDWEPFVGRSAFAHKGGMHIDGVNKAPKSFEHIDPETVGNQRKFLMSEVAGRGTILSKIQKINPSITKDSPETEIIMKKLKELEHEGYQFEGAESSFELVIRKILGKYRPLFELVNFKIIGEQPYVKGQSASAIIKVIVDGKMEITAAEGDGPVNALDKALRKALEVFYPELSAVHLVDYKVRVMDGKSATASKVRVLIESGDNEDRWTTVGVSNDIIEASWLALADSIEYKLIKDIETKFKAYL